MSLRNIIEIRFVVEIAIYILCNVICFFSHDQNKICMQHLLYFIKKGKKKKKEWNKKGERTSKFIVYHNYIFL